MARANGRKQVIKQTVIAIRASTTKIKRMDMAYSIGRVEIYTKGTIKMMKEMALVKCIGLMDLVIKALGNKGFNMAKAR
jgi:hypothetical protein